jgi:phenylacetate-CoA ligase
MGVKIVTSGQTVKSSFPEIVWPAIPSPVGATLLACLHQLEQSQWWTPEKLREAQFRQLNLLFRHACETVPFYRERLTSLGLDKKGNIGPEAFATIPILRRQEIQTEGESLLSQQIPGAHGALRKHETSGSTGRAITTYSTQITSFLWEVFTLRDHAWHGRDLQGKHAVIRTRVGRSEFKGWGRRMDETFLTGTMATLNIETDIEEQAAWLEACNPVYLLSFPSNLAEVAKTCLRRGIAIPKLREVRTFGETLSDDVRQICREAWQVEVTDMYSCQEIGYLALQCPDHQHYHIQSERVLIEVLDDDDRPCAPGEIGRVVVTDLHNFAMPMIRYEILDYAEVGEPCPCGRGLPVLKRIMGRARNIIRLPDGTRHWPRFSPSAWAHIGPIRQIQLVQKEQDLIHVRMAVENGKLNPQQEESLLTALRQCLAYPFRMTVEYLDEIKRSANFKYEDFICEVTDGNSGMEGQSQ